MGNVFKILTAGLLAGLVHSPADAALVSFTGDGNFSNVTTNANDYVIGKITWVNLATYNTDQNFNVKYTFSLNFTSPSNAFDAQVFNLNIQQTTNPSPDNVFNITQATLNNLGPFTLNGVTVS